MTTDIPPPQPAPQSIDPALHEAVARHQAGQLQEAGERYLAILQDRPRHPEANHNLGILKLQMKQPAASLPYFFAALESDPTRGQYWLSYANALMQADQLEAAREVLAMARQRGLHGDDVDALALRLEGGAPVAERPNADDPQTFKEYPSVSPAAAHNGNKIPEAHAAQPDKPALPLGESPSPQESDFLVAIFRQGRYAEAATLAHSMTERFPQHGFGWKVLGAALKQMGRSADALAPMQKAAALAPDDADAHINLGIALHDLGRLNEAEASLRRALQIRPDYDQARYNLGNTLHALDRLDEAEASYRRTLRINPDFADAHSNLGNVLNQLGRLNEAEACYRRALQINPHNIGVHNNLCATLMDLGRPGEAEANLRLVLRIKPDLAEAHNNLGAALMDLGRLGEAEASYRQALQIDPDYAEAHFNLGIVLKETGRLTEAEASYRQALRINPDFTMAHSNLLFLLNYASGSDPSYNFAEACEYGRKISNGIASRFETWSCAKNPERLRIGLVSGDLSNHPVGYFLESLLVQLDQNAVELIAYPSTRNFDALSARIKPHFSAWKSLCGLSDEAAARLIHNDSVHVLIDLSGHSRSNRLPVFAWKPAPVQVSWLGYFATTGVAEMDYLVADPWTLPESEEVYFTEKIWRLPQTRLCFTPPDIEMAVSRLPALTNGHVTFGCFNNLTKMNDDVVALWSSVLAAVPGSRLFLKAKQLKEVAVRQRTIERYVAHGIEADRLILEGPESREKYLAAYHRVDIALDPFPFPGGTTSVEGLWMGVPVLSLDGKRFLSRQSIGILMNAGLPDWIAADNDDYVARAASHAGDLERLARLRMGLRQQVLASPLFDAPSFARNLEEALWGMWTQNAHRVGGNVPPPAVQCGNNSPSGQEKEALVSMFTEGRLAEAAALAQSMTERFPQHGFGWKVLGAALKQMGRSADALAPMQKAAALAPDDADAHINLGIALHDLGRLNEAEASLRRALQIRPDYDQARYNLGNTLHALDRLDEAEASYRRTLRINPDFADAHSNLGNVLNQLGRLNEAEACYRRALLIDPNNADAHYNLGNTLKDLGRLDEAEASYRHALQIKPDYAPAHYNLGITLQEQNRLEEAESSYRRALQIEPEHASAHNNLGNTLKDLGRLTEAEASYRRALTLEPDYATAHSNLGITLKDLGRLDEAEASFRRALRIRPDFADAFSNMLFTLNYHPDKSGEEIFSVYKEYDAKFGAPRRRDWRPHGNSRETNRRLKIGYVSPDFKKHPVRHFLEPLLARHDKSAMELYAYAELAREDGITARYKGYVDHWVSTSGMSAAALADRIRADGIDILVDLAGHTGKNRLDAFALKPAPVSISWIGCGYSTGLTAIDYFLTDKAFVPAGSEELFSEKPWRLATPSYVYRPAEGMGDVNPLPALRSGHITFGTLTRGIRINYRVIRVWAEILKRVEGARLVIDSKDFCEPYTQDILAEKFAVHGVHREQLQMGCHSPPWDVLRGFDIGLDCFPHNSGTTLFETLYMGIPFITLAGRPSVGRIGSSILEGLGHAEWIANTEDEYVEKALALAGNLPKLATLRAGLRGKMQTGPLMDEQGFARAVEAAYREMFEKWAKG